jgi:hypothetical protein
VKAIIAMAFLHNFIRVTDPIDIEKPSRQQSEGTQLNEQPDTVEYGTLHKTGITKAESARATKKRDDIALKMWADYKKILRHRQQHGQRGPTE